MAIFFSRKIQHNFGNNAPAGPPPPKQPIHLPKEEAPPSPVREEEAPPSPVLEEAPPPPKPTRHADPEPGPEVVSKCWDMIFI